MMTRVRLSLSASVFRGPGSTTLLRFDPRTLLYLDIVVIVVVVNGGGGGGGGRVDVHAYGDAAVMVVMLGRVDTLYMYVYIYIFSIMAWRWY